MHTALKAIRMRSEGYGTWSVCLYVCLSVCLLPLFHATTSYNLHNKTYHQIQRDMKKALNLFSLQILRSGIMSIFAYSTKAAVF